jgi:hypothetical protein
VEGPDLAAQGLSSQKKQKILGLYRGGGSS